MNPADTRVPAGNALLRRAANLDGFDAGACEPRRRGAHDGAFLLSNKLIDGSPERRKGVDGSLLQEALHP